MRGQLLSVAWGSTLGSGLLCESVERVLTFTQTTNQRPRAQAHSCLYRDLGLTGDWLIHLSCDPTWCCHPVAWQHSICPLGQTCVYYRNRPVHSYLSLAGVQGHPPSGGCVSSCLGQGPDKPSYFPGYLQGRHQGGQATVSAQTPPGATAPVWGWRCHGCHLGCAAAAIQPCTHYFKETEKASH